MEESRVIPVFASPILVRKFPDYEAANDGLRRVILDRAPPEPSIMRSNVGGWHSDLDLLRWEAPEIRQLAEWIRTAVTEATLTVGNLKELPTGRMNIVAWANLLYRGGYNMVHDHAGYAWSGVYYVDLGSSDEGAKYSGIIEFLDPRAGVSSLHLPGDPFRQRIRISGEVGQMLIFPSWLSHFVHPYQGDTPRISISFNVSFFGLGEG